MRVAFGSAKKVTEDKNFSRSGKQLSPPKPTLVILTDPLSIW